MFSDRRSWRQRVGDPKRNEVSGYRKLHINRSFHVSVPLTAFNVRYFSYPLQFARIQSSIPESFLSTKLKKKMPSGATGVKPDTGLRAKWSSASAPGR
ncbi:hypothetical protein AVEN_139462-1 [Araneus ventricosus]|uniref:Uncharacterized protein n=1 Tax=Araneus ventricosus TaxID=182803 RepID=A0A4Y2SCF0_ARAVE|nr:hypothetical protein AVEN_139462-1 [Araneus ventricosus]